MYDSDKLISFVDGFVTDGADLTDEMYENAAMHNENGAWQMIFGVNTLPEYRQHGYAGELIQKAIADAKEQGRKGLVLTCKDRLVHYYAKFGFVDEGVTEKSTHGNVAWHQMRLTFQYLPRKKPPRVTCSEGFTFNSIDQGSRVPQSASTATLQ